MSADDSFLWYMASPYTAHPEGIETAFTRAAQQVDFLSRNNYRVFSPIVVFHQLALQTGIDPLDQEFWMRVDEPFMERCQGLIVFMDDSWKKSKGVEAEIEHFDRARKPIMFAYADKLPHFVCIR